MLVKQFGQATSQLVEELVKLPGIGRKSAERLAYHLVTCPRAEADQLAATIRQVRETVHPCPHCFNLTDRAVCEICSDPKREQHVVCVVEQPKDLIVLEASGAYHGLYHILGGRISPLERIGPEDLTIDPLIRRIRKQGIREVVMATNPTLDGDGTALFISSLLANEPVRITRLARGIASGSVLEFANKEMLADALRGRQAF